MTTIREVAKKAGVSTATVSRVINQLENVQPKTKTKVQNAIKELGYHPNRIARSLKAEESQQIGVVLPHIANQFFMEVAKGLEDVTSSEGHSLILASSDWDENKELEHLNAFSEQRVRAMGIISVGGFFEEHQNFLQSLNIPYIFADRYIPALDVDFVLPSNVEGIKLITSHLLELGHSKIGFINGYLEMTSGEERLMGYKMALESYSQEINSEVVLEGADYSISTGYELTRKLLTHENITALVCGNNTLAIGALLACKELNVKVPNNLSLVSFGDMDLAPLLDPPLTVATNSGYDMGTEVGSLLLQRINKEGPSKKKIIRIPSKLIVRSSTLPIDYSQPL